jgi:hypothetical protein
MSNSQPKPSPTNSASFSPLYFLLVENDRLPVEVIQIKKFGDYITEVLVKEASGVTHWVPFRSLVRINS